jgi:tetratricopeptide (TPR) repeat protein
LSLLDERAGRFGFRDLASARQIAKLLADGVRLSEIIRSVNEIRKWLPDIGLGSVRFIPVPAIASKSNRLERVLTNAASSCLRSMTAGTIFANAQAAEQAGDIAEAERFYRMLMKGNDPSAALNLGNMLRACGRNVEAEAALHAATRIDPAFAEAWYNLGDLLDDQGRSEAAIESLRKAVQVAPDYRAQN